MLTLIKAARKLSRNTLGQDLVEYALMAGLVGVSAGALMPNVATAISGVFSQVTSVMVQAGGDSGTPSTS